MKTAEATSLCVFTEPLYLSPKQMNSAGLVVKVLGVKKLDYSLRDTEEDCQLL